MTYFRDLDLLDYHHAPLNSGCWAVPLRAVGWLASPHPFETGEVPAAFVASFEALVSQTREAFGQYAFRGKHACDLCPPADAATIAQSHINVLVPGDQEVFAATASLLHYVRVHGYRPPSAFIAATLACPPCDTPAYLEALGRSNAGNAPPLESSAASAARERVLRVECGVFREALGVPIQQASRDQVLRAARVAWPDRVLVDAQEGIFVGWAVARFDAAGRFLDFA